MLVGPWEIHPKNVTLWIWKFGNLEMECEIWIPRGNHYRSTLDLPIFLQEGVYVVSPPINPLYSLLSWPSRFTEHTLPSPSFSTLPFLFGSFFRTFFNSLFQYALDRITTCSDDMSYSNNLPCLFQSSLPSPSSPSPSPSLHSNSLLWGDSADWDNSYSRGW